MAIAQPLLDLYGKNTTVFSSAKMSPVEVSLFLLLVVLGPALVCVSLDRLSGMFGPKVNEAFRLCLISGLSMVLGFAVARWLNLDENLPSLVMGVVFGIAIPVAFDKSRAVREWSRWLAALSVAVLGIAVIALQPVLLRTSGPTSDAVVGNKDVKVLHVIFDEFPLFSLLGPNGTINADRFPGFAELAQGATWYRNSVSVSNFTHEAVPAILSSQIPDQTGGPFLAQYPRNIFTLFGGATSVGGIEPVTSLCPRSVCPDTYEGNSVFNVRRFIKFVRDATYVLGQRVMPPVIRQRIPSIEGKWGGFGVAKKFKAQLAVGALSQVDAVTRAVKTMTGPDTPQVQVVHALLPHAPWRITPDLRVDTLSPTISTANPDDDEVIRDMYQTFLYQVGAADRVLQDVVHTLKESGMWDSTLLVVTADHGISFIPKTPQRNTNFTNSDQVADIYRIPTFIKFPRQVTSRIDDCAISNLDLLPTIIDVTETTTEWNFAGASVARQCPAGRTRTVQSATGQSSVLAGGFEEVRSRADHYATIVSNVGPINRVAAVGGSASLIGRAVKKAPIDTNVSGWTIKQKQMFSNVSNERGAVIPALITGDIVVARPLAVGTEGIIVVDGIAAGVVGELSGANGVTGYAAVLDYSLLTKGSHSVELYVRNIDGVLTSVGAPD
jgi:hypothetical protein